MSAALPAAGELDRARAFIAICRWTYASSVPEAPHEYCLRAWLSREQQVEFDWFVAVIAQHGYAGRFWRQDWTYLDVDDRKYWESRTIDGSGGAIINRARLGLSGPGLKRTALAANANAPAVRPSRG